MAARDGGGTAMSALQRALKLAQRGLPIFPCRAEAETIDGKVRKEKSPYTEHGHKDATTDERTITRWWTRWPDALIGVPTGRTSGLFAIDVDPTGKSWYRENRAELGDARVHRTKRGGYHLIYRNPEGEGITVGVQSISEGVDHRGDGGYIIWWAAHGFDVENRVTLSNLDDLPGWVLDKLTERRPKKKKRKANGHDDSGIFEGERNARLASLAGKMRRQQADVDEIEAALLAFNESRCIPPLDEDEVRTIAHSIARYEPEQQDDRHDHGNAVRILAQTKGDVRYERQRKAFYVWTGERWTEDAGDHLTRSIAVESVKRSVREAADLPDSVQLKQRLDWFRQSLNESRVSAAVEMVKDLSGCHVDINEFDADDMLLGIPGGKVLDLRTGESRRADRSDMVSKVAGAAFDPEATCPRWERFLREITGDDDAMTDYLQELVGHSLSGDTGSQLIAFCYGTGQNGKTVFLETLRDLVGEYGKSLRTDALSLRATSSKNGPNEDIFRLIGARVVTVNETAEGMRFDEALIKDLTGEDTVAARTLYKGLVDFRPRFKLWIRGNHMPEFNGADGGMARRIRLIPFEVRIPDDEVDRTLRAKLKEELSGILNWAIDGCLRWHERGCIDTPRRVRDATADYVQEMDGLGLFVEERVVSLSGVATPIASVYSDYDEWCRGAGIRMPITRNRFTVRMKGRGFAVIKQRNRRCFAGIKVKSDFR